MIVEGLANPSHLIRLFLSQEYGFSIQYKELKEVRIGHHKGTWFLAKLKNNEIIDYAEICDWFAGITTKNEMLTALYNELTTQWMKKHPEGVQSRGEEACIVEKLLAIWGGSTSKIEKLSVVQAGRNSSVDERTGEFLFSPRPDEFLN